MLFPRVPYDLGAKFEIYVNSTNSNYFTPLCVVLKQIMAFSLSLVLKRDSYFISKQATFVAVLLLELSNDEKKMNEFENNTVSDYRPFTAQLQLKTLLPCILPLTPAIKVQLR